MGSKTQKSVLKNVLWYLGAPFRLLYKIWFLLIFIISALFMYPVFLYLLKDDTKIEQAFKMKRIWAKILLGFCLIKVKVNGAENLPKKPYVLVANHGSYLDILAMFVIIPELFLFLGKAELLKWPVVRVFFKNMDIPVDRGNRTKAARSLELTREAVRKGHSVAIFPEGLIPRTGLPKMKPFKKGAFNLAISTQVPLVPISFLDNWKLFSDHTLPFGPGRPGLSRAIIHAPVSTIGKEVSDAAELSATCYEAIEKGLIRN